jgi:hypothetical protein
VARLKYRGLTLRPLQIPAFSGGMVGESKSAMLEGTL